MYTDQDDNWAALLFAMQAGTVIPVMGPDLLEIPGTEAAEPHACCLLRRSAWHRATRRPMLPGQTLQSRCGPVWPSSW